MFMKNQEHNSPNPSYLKGGIRVTFFTFSPPLGLRGGRGALLKLTAGGVRAVKSRRNDPILKRRRRELRLDQTEAEKTLWSRLRNGKLYRMKFFRQYSVGPYILDFYCPQIRVAIELDGGQHTEDDRREYDAMRSAYLKAQGIEVMRFWNHEVLHQTESVLQRVIRKVTPPNPLLTQEGEQEEVTFPFSPPLGLRGGRGALLKLTGLNNQ
jgi:very-short-patch-repair endonuclease